MVNQNCKDNSILNITGTSINVYDEDMTYDMSLTMPTVTDVYASNATLNNDPMEGKR